MKRLAALFFAALAVGPGSPALSAASNPRYVCIAKNGALIVRENKCLSGETKASKSNLPQRGAKGAAGPAGASGLSGRRVDIFGDRQSMLVGNQAHSFSFCEDDEVLVGGGCACFNFFCNTGIESSSPLPVDPAEGGREGWRCVFSTNLDFDTGVYTAYSICADAQ